MRALLSLRTLHASLTLSAVLAAVCIALCSVHVDASSSSSSSSSSLMLSLSSRNGSSATQCADAVDDSFFNACRREYPSGILALFANFVMQWINPRFTAQAAVGVVMFLPLAFSTHMLPLRYRSLRWYRRALFATLNFLHRMSYSLVLDVVLYTVFRQRRPCLCPASPSGGPLVPVGSIYGMPSGDAMGGALFGMLLVHHGPYHAVLSRALGVLSIVWVCYERAVLGFHSIGQVTAGASIGIALHFYNFFTPQALIVVDVLVMVAAGLPVMFADPAIMHTAPGDLNNLFSWYFWGLAIELFTLVCLARFYWSPLRLRDLRFSYRRLMASHEALDAAGLGATDRAAVTTSSSYGTRVLVDGDVEERELDAELDEGSAVLGERARVPRAASLRRMLGTNWMASGAVVMCVVMFLSSCIAQYGWMGWQPQP